MNIQNALKEKFSDLVGEIKIQNVNNTVLLSGNVFVSDKEAFKKDLIEKIGEKYPTRLLSNSLKINEFVVVEEEVHTNVKQNEILDEVNVLYSGYMDISHIKPNNEFKIIHENNRERLDNIVKVLNFISPIILDSDLKVIDGNFRLQLAAANNVKKVLVVVIDDNDKKADFLRLALNRTAEFQRWAYREVDSFVDSLPQAQPLLEPIGFFGQHVLPTSFFSDTVISYVIDPFNEKQKQYSQEEGLAEWAKYRRAQMDKLSKEKRAEKPKKTNAISLFDLAPKKEDFLETYEINEEMEEFVDKYKDIAGKITDSEDAKKKAELEASGGVWQRSHRSSQTVADDRRSEAIEAVQATTILSDDEKMIVITDIDQYAGLVKDMEKVAAILRGEI